MSNHNTTGTASTRRVFLGKTAAALTASTLLSSAGCSNTMKRLSGSARSPLIGKGDVILFQGDSITDAGRNRAREGNANDRSALGGGYAWTKGALRRDTPPAACAHELDTWIVTSAPSIIAASGASTRAIC